MKVLALTEGPSHVCYRYRLAPFAAALQERGWTLESLPLSTRPLVRSSQLREAAQADLVVLQRRLLPLWQLRLLRSAARRLIYDFDDALFCRDSYSTKAAPSWTRLARFWATIYAADGVVAGNQFLCAQAGQYIDPAKVQFIPTCVDPANYNLARHERRGAAVRLGWIGQRSTLPCLYHAERLLVAAAEALPGLRLRVICDRYPQLLGVRVVPRTWSGATESEELADLDIGISWLPDDEWSRGKCGLKVLQYMAAGLPVVANPVGENATMVRHGETGFLASTPEEWASAIARLAHDPELRARMGTAGREHLERHYHVHRWSHTFAEFVDRLGRPSLPVDRLGTAAMERIG